MRTMENENLRVQISDHGAELSSIYDKAADREAVWIGDPAFWNRHAPVLFPFVGKVNGGFYTHKGVKYPMGQHGFARDNEFECIENTENKTVHRLVSTEETKKVYPFDFAFTVTQELSGRTLTITWNVENTGDDDTDNSQCHNTACFFTDAHSNGCCNGLWKQCYIMGMGQSQNTAHEENTNCTGGNSGSNAYCNSCAMLL